MDWNGGGGGGGRRENRSRPQKRKGAIIAESAFSRRLIIGTAGHIDHGKTALVKRLTGVNTDRLKEERERGITIELGFATLMLSDGRRAGVVDVPGHEKFVRNMVAGASGIDMVIMVIAADEGVMPQTREHLDICRLLGIRHGLVALTKFDMADEEWRELVTGDVEDFLSGTFLEDQPMIPVSSVTGEGIADLMAAIEKIASGIPEKPDTGIFRLPVDRVFTMKGYGSVVTGTLVSGSVSTGDEVMLYPSLTQSRVRGLQVHDESVDTAFAGQRTAVNFQGLDLERIGRGNVLSRPGILQPSYLLDARFRYLEGNTPPLKNRARVRLHIGTADVFVRIVLLESEQMTPGDEAVVQLRLEAPLAVLAGDRFVVRALSPVRSIGGGVILHPAPPKRRRFQPETTALLSGLDSLAPSEAIRFHAREAGVRGVSFADLRVRLNMTDKKIDTELRKLLSARQLTTADRERRIYLHPADLERLKDAAREQLRVYHRQYPLKPGMPAEELRSRLPSYIPSRTVHMAVARLVQEELAVQEKDLIRLVDHRISLAADDGKLKAEILEKLRTSGLTPPETTELEMALRMDSRRLRDMLVLLEREGHVLRIGEKLWFSREAVETLRKQVIVFFQSNEEMSTPDFKRITGVSRKYLIPLIEYFDAAKWTIRVGDVRKLRQGIYLSTREMS